MYDITYYNKVPRVLVGNKIDCKGRAVNREEAEKFAKSKKLSYFECSAKLNEGVYDIFYALTEMGLSKKGAHKPKQSGQEGVNLQKTKKKKKRSFCVI